MVPTLNLGEFEQLAYQNYQPAPASRFTESVVGSVLEVLRKVCEYYLVRGIFGKYRHLYGISPDNFDTSHGGFSFWRASSGRPTHPTGSGLVIYRIEPLADRRETLSSDGFEVARSVVRHIADPAESVVRCSRNADVYDCGPRVSSRHTATLQVVRPMAIIVLLRCRLGHLLD